MVKLVKAILAAVINQAIHLIAIASLILLILMTFPFEERADE